MIPILLILFSCLLSADGTNCKKIIKEIDYIIENPINLADAHNLKFKGFTRFGIKKGNFEGDTWFTYANSNRDSIFMKVNDKAVNIIYNLETDCEAAHEQLISLGYLYHKAGEDGYNFDTYLKESIYKSVSRNTSGNGMIYSFYVIRQ